MRNEVIRMSLEKRFTDRVSNLVEFGHRESAKEMLREILPGFLDDFLRMKTAGFHNCLLSDRVSLKDIAIFHEARNILQGIKDYLAGKREWNDDWSRAYKIAGFVGEGLVYCILRAIFGKDNVVVIPYAEERLGLGKKYDFYIPPLGLIIDAKVFEGEKDDEVCFYKRSLCIMKMGYWWGSVGADFLGWLVDTLCYLKKTGFYNDLSNAEQYAPSSHSIIEFLEKLEEGYEHWKMISFRNHLYKQYVDPVLMREVAPKSIEKQFRHMYNNSLYAINFGLIMKLRQVLKKIFSIPEDSYITSSTSNLGLMFESVRRMRE